MKITERLAGDHRTFRKFLSELDQIADQPAGQWDRNRLGRLTLLFKDHLSIHAWAEDTFYYPEVRKHLTSSSGRLTVAYMDHLDQEHRQIDAALDRLENELKNSPTSTTWPQMYALFSKGLQAHMRKEEEELFPLSEELLGAPTLEMISNALAKLLLSDGIRPN